MSRPSQTQMEKLVQFLEENPGIAKGHLRTAQARHHTKIKWEEIAISLNSLGGTTKDAKSWAKYWADKKYALKKLVAQRNASANRTGGGVSNLQPTTELEERLIYVMGGSSFAAGDQELSVPLINTMEPEATVPLSPVHIDVQVQNELMPSTSQATNSPARQGSTPIPSSPIQSPRVRRRRLPQNQLHIERQRLIRIEEKRVAAEEVNAAALRSIGPAIDNLANAIITAADRIAQAIQNQPNNS